MKYFKSKINEPFYEYGGNWYFRNIPHRYYGPAGPGDFWFIDGKRIK